MKINVKQKNSSTIYVCFLGGEKYVSGGLFENKWEVGTKNYNWVSQYI